MVATVAQPTTAADVCSVIWKATEVLTTIKRYKKHCNPLKEALLRLHEVLKNVESQRSQEPDVLKSSSLFLDARVSVSKTYLIVEGVATYNFMTGPKYWWTICTPCFTDDPNPDRLRTQLAETLKLVDDLSSTFKVKAPSAKDVQAIAGSGDRLFGANKLELVTDKNLQQQVADGDGTVSISITNTRGETVYTVREWRRDPEAESGTSASYSLAASLECGDGTNRKVVDISLTDSAEQRASIACSGVLQAELVSALNPNDPPVRICCFKVRNTVVGSLLHRGRYVKKSQDNDALEYAVQPYSVIIRLETLGLEGLVSGPPLKQLKVNGMKSGESVYYECLVEGSQEPLASYRHNLPQANHGTIELLGVANHAALREIIVSAFVAMGLAKDL